MISEWVNSKLNHNKNTRMKSRYLMETASSCRNHGESSPLSPEINKCCILSIKIDTSSSEWNSTECFRCISL